MNDPKCDPQDFETCYIEEGFFRYLFERLL